MKYCKKCNERIPTTIKIDGRTKNLSNRHYCLQCSPFGEKKSYEIRKSANPRYTKGKFTEIVMGSISIAEVIDKLGLVVHGSNYLTVKRKIKEFNIDTSHFKGQRHAKGTRHSYTPRMPLEDILVADSSYGSTTRLKTRLIEENYFVAKCYNCENTLWLGNPIPIQLHHINGDPCDNRIENLTLLCPNCHALTDSYCGRNVKKRNCAARDSNPEPPI